MSEEARKARERLERLSGARGPAFWRSLEELAATPEFEEILHAEFPRHASEWTSGLDRRRFLQLSGATMALAGLTACTRQPLERIVPYVKQPEEIVPGRPLFYATASTLGGYAMGLLVESHEGRPTKIEGNPLHPASLGATDAFAQASILGLYDPDRSQVLTELGTIQTWAAFSKALTQRLAALRALQGEGLRILTETVTSPTLADQIRTLLAKYPKARWHQWESAGRDSVRAGAKAAFGRYVDTIYDFAAADVVVSLDADFVMEGPGRVRYARDFASRRKVRGKPRDLCRLYMVETAPTNTGTMADHRLSSRAAEVPALAAVLAAELGVAGVSRAASEPRLAAFASACASDLRGRRGAGIVVPGEFAPPEVHVLAHAMNTALGNVGQTVHYIDPVEAEPTDQLASLRALTADMSAGRVDTLVILGGNPVYTAPADLDFAQALLKVPLRAHLALEDDETSSYCQWHVPAAHELETWSDARAHDGTTTVLQPLIEPLYGGRSPHEILSLMLDDPPQTAYDVVRAHWKKSMAGASFEATWRKVLHDGVLGGPSLTLGSLAVEAGALVRTAGSTPAPPAGEDRFELIFRPDPTIHDGRFANNGWLQELPKAHSKLTWDNAALLAPAAAARLGAANGDVVEIAADGRTLRAPVWIQPGHPDGAVTLHLGYGRRRTGRVGAGAGFDANALRTSAALWSAPGATIRKTDETHSLATTQEHFSMEGRHLVRVGTLEEYRHEPHFAQEEEEKPPRDLNFFPGQPYPGYAWGLSIDLSACTGCNACVLACASENNTPVVGKDQVMRGREMHWIRIDRYYAGELDDPRTHHQPVMCMQCEQAPCELVCPVAATNHSSEGLNDMVYNRCVGTRYCSNNCPYKVRRFNFLEYNGDRSPVLKLLHNPDVTVRSRGVMEKCTYCVQRINETRIVAERESRKIADGEIVTACQQACPTEAIVFGDINDPQSRVSRLKAEATSYGLLEPLNTRPRTTYLAKIVDPNPSLRDAGIDETSAVHGGTGHGKPLSGHDQGPPGKGGAS